MIAAHTPQSGLPEMLASTLGAAAALACGCGDTVALGGVGLKHGAFLKQRDHQGEGPGEPTLFTY